MESRHIDVLEMDAASHNSVDDIRQINDAVRYAPVSARYKVYILDEVHMLSGAAFNALLKTLEEPPEHVKFMFATTDPEKVLPTILSRCQRFDLRRIPADLISKHLLLIAKKENVKIEPAALFAIARGAEGAMRDAESTLDQLISFCGDTIEEADVLSMFGLTAQGQLLDLSRAILSGEVENSLRQLHDLATHGKDLSRLVSDLLNQFRNLLIFHVSGGDLRMLEVSEAEAASLGEQSKLAEAQGLTRIMEVFADAEMRLREASSKKILVEVTLLKAIEARNAVSIDTVLEQLRRLRQDQGAEVVSIPVPPPAAQPSSMAKPFRAEAAAASPSDPEQVPTALREHPVAAAPAENASLHELWRNLLEAVGRVSAFTRTYLLEAHPVAFNKTLLTIGFDPEFEDHIGLVDVPRNHTLLQTKLAEFGHPNVQIKFVKAEPPAGWQPPERTAAAQESPPPVASRKSAPPVAATPKEKPAPVAFSKDDFKNDPLIQKALEIFKGQIVEVRA